MKGETLQRVATPTAILVGLAEPVASAVETLLDDGGLKVLKVGHVAGACERIPVTMPQLVVISVALRPDEIDMITDRCVAVGAQVIKVELQPDMKALAKTFKDAATMAFIRALGR